MVDMEATTTAFFSMNENIRATSSARLSLDAPRARLALANASLDAAMLDLLATNNENRQIDDQGHEVRAH